MKHKFNLITDAKDWVIMYSSYDDLFQMYDNQAFIDNQRSEFFEKKEDDYRIFINKKTDRPVFFEIKKAYDKFSVDFNDMLKSDILKLLKPQIEKYV